MELRWLHLISCRAELCSFLSSNRYDLLLLQEIILSSSRYFKVPGYSVFRTNRTLTRRDPAIPGDQNGGGVLTLINSDFSFQMVPSPVPTLTLSDLASDYLCVKINFQKHSLFYSSMSTPLLSETLNSIFDYAPFLLNFPRSLLTPLLSMISMPITPPRTLTSLRTVLAIPYSIGSHPPG